MKTPLDFAISEFERATLSLEQNGHVTLHSVDVAGCYRIILEAVKERRDDLYLIWSNEHNGWWGPASRGYSPGLLGAGTYTREQAMRICRDAIPTAGHVRRISEIPVRYADVTEFLAGQPIPASIMTGDR